MSTNPPPSPYNNGPGAPSNPSGSADPELQGFVDALHIHIAGHPAPFRLNVTNYRHFQIAMDILHEDIARRERTSATYTAMEDSLARLNLSLRIMERVWVYAAEVLREEAERERERERERLQELEGRVRAFVESVLREGEELVLPRTEEEVEEHDAAVEPVGAAAAAPLELEVLMEEGAFDNMVNVAMGAAFVVVKVLLALWGRT